MRIGILGWLEARAADSTPVTVGGTRPRALLVLLALNANRVVGVEATLRKGRVAPIGDAAYGNTLGGLGSGLAVVGVYVLAGELHQAGGDHVTGFGRYNELFRPYAKSGNAGRFLAPRTKRGIRMRNWLFKRKALFGAMMKLTDRLVTKIDLPEYGARTRPAASPARRTRLAPRGSAHARSRPR